ncbi:hypothetical protein CLAIMM_01494 [Cladophialophora immunda]|nr:hypothetical protein CLAIMM_01494 [Cladophialophora immunda]
MFDTRRKEAEHPARPSLSTIRSDESQGNNDTVPITRTDTVAVKTRGSTSLGRKNSDKPTVLSRSETLSSKPALTRVPSIQTRYMEMLLHLDQIPRLYNILASLFTWILLAGFLVVPGTFTTFKNSKAFQNADNDNDDNEVAHAIVHSIANIGLLWLAGAFCAVGALGCLWLWFRWRKNYVWLINRIFLPVTMNSVAGLITTLVNVYTAQHGVSFSGVTISGYYAGYRSCYYSCEDRGYHLDPDVRVGLETSRNAYRYWVSEGDITDPTLAVEEPCASLEFSAVGTSERPHLPTSSETKSKKVVFKRKDLQSAPQTDFLTGSTSPPLPSIPNTPNATPRVQIPNWYLESSMNGRPPDYHSDYLYDVRIPSPLLYHNSQLEYVRPSNDPRPTWSAPGFEFAHGQQKPEPDFTSYRPIENSDTQDERTNLQRHGSLGFAICTAASSRHKAEASHISDDSHDSSTHGDASPLPDCLASRGPTGRIQDYPSTADTNSNQTVAPNGVQVPWYTHSFMRKNSDCNEVNLPRDVGITGDNLIFPTMPTPVHLEHTLAAHCSINSPFQPEVNRATGNWEKVGTGLYSCPGLVDNTPLPSISDAVEAAVRAVRRGREAQATQLSPGRKDDEFFSDGTLPGALSKAGLSPCMDIVPARLYRHQFLPWPPANSLADVGRRRSSDMTGVLRMVDWLEELNTPRPYEDGPLGVPVLTPQLRDTDFDLSKDILTSESALSPVFSAQLQCHRALSVHEAAPGRHDEGYFTCCERYSEVDLLNEPSSDEEWADWDWDFELDHVDDRIGLFGTEWEAASKEDML